MSIALKNCIVHILDLEAGQPILSTQNLALDDEIEKFIIKHVNSQFSSHIVAAAEFQEDSEVLEKLKYYTDESFYSTSCMFAERFYQYMTMNGNIPSGDLLVASVLKDGEEYLVILKLNYSEAFTHYVENGETGGVTQIIKHKSIFPSTTKKVQEVVIINMSNYHVFLLDNSKERYLTPLLELETGLSVKEKLDVVEQVTGEVIEEFFDNPTEAITTLKSNIAESIFESSVVPIKQVIEDTFKEYEEVSEGCIQKIEECGFLEEDIQIINSREAKKYTSHKLKTSTGVEIKLPTDMMRDSNYIEFINNPDGSLSIMIKNVGEIINK